MVSTNESIKKHQTDIKNIERKITIKQLLTHTSGLSHGLGENLYEKQLFKFSPKP